MKVAIDARSAQDRPLAGVGRGIAAIVPNLAKREDLQIELLTAREKDPADLGPPEHPLATPWPGLATGWLQWSAPRWLRSFDGVFHCPWYALPARQTVPMVVTLHDLTFEHHTQYFRPSRRISYRAQARLAARTAGAVMAPSEHVANDIRTIYHVPDERLFVAPNCADSIFSPDVESAQTLARLNIRKPYVAAVGGAARRNVHVAIAAWRAAREHHPGLELVVVGTTDVAAEPGLHVGRLDDTDWAAVLAGAVALVYPTEYEGFGMPALEAISSGTPVICAPVGALPEVLGPTTIECAAITAAEFHAGN